MRVVYQLIDGDVWCCVVGSDERERASECKDEWGKIVENKVGLTTIFADR
jgi:hypothetical protein